MSSPFLNRRLKSIFGDFMFIIIIFLPICVLFMIPSIFLVKDFDGVMKPENIMLSLGILPYSLFLFMILNKDFFQGRSVAKRIQGYQVVNHKTSEVASEVQCMLRNITLIICPIEAFFILISPKQRLGDVIAGTRVIDKEQIHPETILAEMNGIDKSKNHKRLIYYSIAISIFYSLIASLSTLI